MRDFTLVRTRDQWLRCAHEETHLDEDGVLGLAWTEPSSEGTILAPPQGPPAGLAYDSRCRLFRSVPEEGRIERTEWPWGDPPSAHRPPPEAVDLFAPADAAGGVFRPREEDARPLHDPRGIAVNAGDRLLVCEAGAARLLVYDLPSRRLLRSLPVTEGTPVDVAASGPRNLVLLHGPAGLLELEARGRPSFLPVWAGGEEAAPFRDPAALAVAPDGTVAVLDRAGADEARVILLEPAERPGRRPRRVLAIRSTVPVPRATGVAYDPEGRLAVGRFPGEPLLRFAFPEGTPVAARPLRARGYDGRGLVRDPEGRIAFWSRPRSGPSTGGGNGAGSGAGARPGPARAISATVRYRREGRTVTFRLDSGAFRTRWGRIFLEACVPDGCRIRVRAVSADEPPPGDLLPWTPPGGAPDPAERPEGSPPLPPVALLPAEDTPAGSLHPRETGRELPWAPHGEGSSFRTFEGPVRADEGRYLWVTLELTGTTRRTPRVRALRVEHPGHGLLDKLPRVFSRDREGASFLRRYLAMPDGLLQDLDVRAGMRHVLLDPRSAPEEALPWLAGFLGLMLDDRWPVEARRTAIQEAPDLFRFRGTVPGLRRFLAIFAGEPVVLVEHFRLRGLGGALIGDETPRFANAVVGTGLRVGGEVGSAEPAPLEGTTRDAFRTHAHRFTVLLGRALDTEGLDVVRRILELHRPAHTTFQVCTAAAGMRVGRGLHVELSSFVGPTSGFAPLTLGDSPVGRGGVLGVPRPGTAVDRAAVGMGTEVG